MNSLISLKEYRCVCGKLLFKGLMLSSLIEIKCKRCGKVTSIGGISDSWEEENHYSFIIDHTARIVSCSKSVEAILGYQKSELEFMPMRDLHTGFQSEEYEYLWQKMRNTHDSFSLDMLHRAKNGQMIPVKIFTRFLGARNEEYAIVVVERLRELSDVFFKKEFSLDKKIVLDHVSDFSAEINLKGAFTYISDKSLGALGYTANEIIGKPLFELYPEEDRKMREREYSALTIIEQPFRILNAQLLRKDKNPLPFSGYFNPRFGDLRGFSGYSVASWFSNNLRG